jgi:GntR family transcriptional regulator
MTQAMTPANLVIRFAAINNQQKPSIPKYLRVCEVVREMLVVGELSPGDRLPPELELARLLPVSLGTVQKAMNTLTRQGVLERLQGSGTFVSDKTSELHDLWHFRFIGSNGEQILPVHSNTIAIEETTATGPWSRFLRNAKQFAKITRHIDINHSFGAIGQFYLNSAHCPGLLQESPEYFDGAHLRDIIHKRFNLSTARVNVQVRATGLPDNVCQWLNLENETTGLECHIMGVDIAGLPLSFQHVFVPPGVSPLEIRESHPLSD